MGASLNITVHDSLSVLDQAEWDDLFARCPSATVFQRLQWLQPWLESFAQQAHVVLLIARRNGRLVGAAPLYVDDDLKFIGHEHSDYNLFLADPSEPGVLELLLAEMERLIPRGRCALLQEIPEDSAFARALFSRAKARGSWIRATHRTPCPFLVLNREAGAWEPASLRRHARRLPQSGPVEVRHERSAAAILEQLPAFFEQHVRRWEGTTSPSLFRRDANRRFYEAVTQRLAPLGAVVFTVVRLEGHPCASHFGLVSGRDLLWYKPSFDIALARLSPGQFMLLELVRFARAEGLERLDFTRGDEPFKRRITHERRYNASVAVLPGARRRLLFDTKTGARRVRDRLRSAFTFGG